jgi:SAM-dependent methyltransferase
MGLALHLPIDDAAMSELYRHPDDYDLEHLGHDEDVEFYLSLVRRLRPKRILELGCGTGRVTIPLAQLGGKLGFSVIGLDSQPEMLERAGRRRMQCRAAIRQRVNFVQGDMRSWTTAAKFDLIVIPCSSVTHVLKLEDQIALWRNAWHNLRAGGRFLVEVMMPDIAAFAGSCGASPRVPIEVDLDNQDDADGIRMIRRKTTRYLSHEQRAEIRFMYEKYRWGQAIGSFIDDFNSHVFFPRELHLLFIHTGFKIEATCGDYRGRPLRPDSSLIIMTGVKATRRTD